MKPLARILAATDFSAPAHHAAQRAALLARDIGARLELVHILEKSALDELRRAFGAEGETLQECIRAQAREALAQLAADIGAPLGVSAGQYLLEGAVLEGIATEAERLDASLLIVGARGADFMRHWLLGATAERLLRKTRRPILVVKQPARDAYRSVLVPVDFSPWSQGAMRLAQAVAPRAEIVLLHAFEAPFEGKLRFAGVAEETIQRHRAEARQEALARLHQAATEAGFAETNGRAIAVHGGAAPRILEQEEVQGADLIVLGKHGAGMTEELLLGSVTKHVLAHARGDVLVAWR
ncbi:MAG: universal stress protein [Azonexus sp.]|nr:universal stress protein [Azonexus sp.]